jgi:hypothetical protein
LGAVDPNEAQLTMESKIYLETQPKNPSDLTSTQLYREDQLMGKITSPDEFLQFS